MAVVTLLGSMWVGSMWVGPMLFASPQAPAPGVQQQIRAQYPVTQAGADGDVSPGGQALIVQLDGMKAYYANFNRSYYPNHFKKGGKRLTESIGGAIIHMPVGGPGAIPQIAAGTKVYLTGIEFKKEEVVFSVQSCGVCAPGSPDPTALRASVVFQFPKGFLETASYNAIQETISRVFAIDTSPPAQPTAPPAEAVEQSAQPVQPPEQPSEPARQQVVINLGDTIDQVMAAMGQPERKGRVGNKDIFSYKDMKITFVNGKVTDIQ